MFLTIRKQRKMHVEFGRRAPVVAFKPELFAKGYYIKSPHTAVV